MRSSWFAAVVAMTWMLAPLQRVDAQVPLQVGAAEVDITPPIGFPMAGYYHERLAEGSLDPLKAKALVFRSGPVQAAMVVCDLTGISRDLCLAVRERASAQTGIPADAIAVSATHSHTAPDYTKHLYQYLEKSKNPGAGQGTSAGDSPYAEKLIGGAVAAIVQAHAGCETTRVESASLQQETPVSFNRRFVMKDGSVQTWRNLADPKVVRAAGPIDPEIGLVTFASPSGKMQAVLSNFALHLDTVGGQRWSADYPYFIEQSVRKKFDKSLVSIFGTGCCGDINHSDPSRRERNKTDFIGSSLGATIEAGFAQTKPIESTTLRVRSKVVQLPLQEITPEALDRSSQLLKLIGEGGKVEFLDQVTAYKTVMMSQFRNATRRADFDKSISWGLSRAWSGIGDTLPVDVQTIALGDEVAIVFLPGEVFVDLGLAIKRASPFRQTLIVELSNCVETAYIPTRAAYAGGSYEVTNSTVKPGSGEMLVEAALALLRDSRQ